MVTGLTVCGNDDRIGALNKKVKHGDQFKVIDHSFIRLLYLRLADFLLSLSLSFSVFLLAWTTDCECSGDSLSHDWPYLLLRAQ